MSDGVTDDCGALMDTVLMWYRTLCIVERQDVHSAQLRDVGAVLFVHCKCDARLRVPLIEHYDMCVQFGFVISATVMILRYILSLLSMCMVRGFYLQS